MKYVVITKDEEVKEACKRAFYPDDYVTITSDWREGLAAGAQTDLMFVDLLATLEQPGRIAGYEKFAEVKMADPISGPVPLVLIWPPEDYQLDFMTGYPDFISQHIRRPVTYQVVRRATTYI
jgi:hypothetical protein